ncbi:Hypothetical protein, putative [Bodo saltans]|uniref:Translation elongation factor EF1B beta/delta subunit guanine nucleotide exchange domain-containing protein n=1 Tax=Bodo saltans TaxID=75058 RepID=A0A0S4JMC5_BODSA|nr:Hypothetical protein, putative [Bodo saltans]|eukprot:CUG90541.1 Hypothetical protein, putative [Bodo saltans]
MSHFIVGVRGCPDTVQLPLQVTAKTTFFDIQKAVADKICVSPKAVAVFAKGLEVTAYTSELGSEFSVNNFITYELRMSMHNAPENIEDLKAHALDFMCCSGCKTNLAVKGKCCTLNCGCTLCPGCADKQQEKGDHQGSILCPYHHGLTSNDVQFHPKSLCGNDEFCAEAPSSTRHEGPHDVLDKLLVTQQCQFTTLEDGIETVCCNTNLVRCRCDLPPMCTSCMQKHLERTTAEVGRHGHLTQSPVPIKELLSRCQQHESRSAEIFHSRRSALLCNRCYNWDMDPKDIAVIAGESHIQQSTAAVTKTVDELTNSIQRLENAKASALKQNNELLKNRSENIIRLSKNCDDFVKDTEEQFESRISQLEAVIAKLKADCAAGVRAIRVTTKSLEDDFAKKIQAQQASIVAYIQTADRLLHSTRTQLAAVAHTARVAPEIVPAVNAVVDFSKRFYSECPTAITIEQCVSNCALFKPLVRIIATTDASHSTNVLYRSVRRSMTRNLRRGNILKNDIASTETLPGLSLKEIQQYDAAVKAKADSAAAAKAAKAKADAAAAAKAKAEQEAAAAAAKAKADAAAAAKAKAEQVAAAAAAHAEQAAAAAKKKKVKVATAKSTILIDITPMHNNYDLEDLAAWLIRAIVVDGLAWGDHKLVATTSGLNIRQVVVVEDSKVSSDDLQRIIESDEHVSSANIVATKTSRIYNSC